MRTVDATLTAALAAGTGKPFIKAYVGYSNGTVKNSHTTVWKYRLTGQTLEFWIPSIANLASDQEQIWLERGLTIAGTDYTVTTGRFWIWEEEYLPNRVTRFKGGLVPREYYSDDLTTDTYETVIDAFFAAFGKTTTYKDDTEDWLDYQFMPNPTDLKMTDAPYMLDLLAQKRLLGCCDNGAEDVRIFCADVLGSSLGTITVQDEFSLSTTKRRSRQYLWVDETLAYGQDGTITDPVHNLGFQAAADAPPARNSQTFEARALIRPDLRWQDGDTIRLSLYGGSATATFFARVIEEFDTGRIGGDLPHWRTILEAWPVFGNTEGGDLPDTVAARASFAPLNVSNFDTVLTANESNVQRAIDKLDDIGKWLTWTPTYSCTGAMTYTDGAGGPPTTNYARYCVVGKIVFFAVRATGTIGGTPSTQINITAAHTMTALSAGFSVAAGGTNDGVPLIGRTPINTAVSLIQILKQDGTAWAAGANRILTVAGFYAID